MEAVEFYFTEGKITMEHENVDHIVSGALFEFAGFLTSKIPNYTIHSSSISLLILRTLEEFLKVHSISKEYPALNWENGLKKT